ncbi:MAG: hypothetical protein BWY85_01194 [Firmicutes bacterium ADurb.Bin506]|nr:MAG: hypothetical protein BWY85_01194 [Firmicutes bacterium ADurb.Bin506]
MVGIWPAIAMGLLIAFAGMAITVYTPLGRSAAMAPDSVRASMTGIGAESLAAITM